MAQLVLHIGTHKTATTSLQRFMLLNAPKFQEQGLSVPRMPAKFPRINRDRTGYFLGVCAKRSIKGESWKPEYDEFMIPNRARFREVAAQGGRVFLSDERLWYEGAQNGRFWQALRQEAEEGGVDSFRLVVYLRRQDEFIASLWAEYVKGYIGSTLQEYLNRESSRRVMDYLSNLKSIEECFGEGSVTVRLFDEARRAEGGVYGDFCDAIGVEYDSGSFEIPETLNPSLTRNAIEIKRIANMSPAYVEAGNFLRRTAIETSIAFDDVPGASLDAETRDELLAAYAESNAQLAREYFGREDGILFPAPGDRGNGQGEWSMMTPEMLRDMCFFFAEAAAAERMQNRYLEKRVARLERWSPIWRLGNFVRTAILHRKDPWSKR